MRLAGSGSWCNTGRYWVVVVDMAAIAALVSGPKNPVV
jgi:lipocalin